LSVLGEKKRGPFFFFPSFPPQTHPHSSGCRSLYKLHRETISRPKGLCAPPAQPLVSLPHASGLFFFFFNKAQPFHLIIWVPCFLVRPVKVPLFRVKRPVVAIMFSEFFSSGGAPPGGSTGHTTMDRSFPLLPPP